MFNKKVTSYIKLQTQFSSPKIKAKLATSGGLLFGYGSLISTGAGAQKSWQEISWLKELGHVLLDFSFFRSVEGIWKEFCNSHDSHIQSSVLLLFLKQFSVSTRWFGLIWSSHMPFLQTPWAEKGATLLQVRWLDQWVCYVCRCWCNWLGQPLCRAS